MASIGDINNLKDKDDNDLGMVPTHYFDAQGNKRNIAEDVAAIYQAINGKADSSQVGQAIGQLTQAVNSKADESHKHVGSDIKYEHTDEINFSKNANDSYSSTVYFNYRDGSTDSVNSQNLISTYRFCNRNGTTVGVTLQADQFTGNAATASSASKWTNTMRMNITDGEGHYGFNCDFDGSTNVEIYLPKTIQATKFIGPLQGNVTGNVTGNCSGSSGSCSGNAATATKATKDGDGNIIASAKAFRWNSFGAGDSTWRDTWYAGSNLTVTNSYSTIRFSDDTSDNLPISGAWLGYSGSGDDSQPLASGGWRECIVTIDLIMMYTATVSQMCTVELVTSDGSNYVPYCARSAMRFYTLGDGATHQVNLHCEFTLRRDDADISAQAKASNNRPCKPAIIRTSNSGTVTISNWVIWTRVLGRRYKSSETHPFG